MTWYVGAAVLAVGFASGVLSALLGVGGAVLTTPGIRVLGATPIEAVGSTVPAILPGAISGTVRYSREGLVSWRVGLTCGLAGALLAIAGAYVAGLVDAHYLMVITAVIAAWSGVVVFRSARTTRHDPDDAISDGHAHHETHDVASPDAAPVNGGTPSGSQRDPDTIGIGPLALVGAIAGLLAGLLGVGGGVVMMPIFTNVLRIPIKQAVASSLVAVAIFSIPAFAAHALLGHINWAFAVLLTIGVVPGAQLGSHITVGASDRTMRHLFGGFLVTMAIVYGTAELVAIVRG